MIVNLHGGTRPLDEHVRGERLVLVQTDPVRLEMERHDWVPESHAFAGAHVAWFSFAELLGQPGCGLPVPPYPVRPTRQPVLLDMCAHRWDVPETRGRPSGTGSRADGRSPSTAERTGGASATVRATRRSLRNGRAHVSRPRSVASMRTTPGASSDRGGQSSTPVALSSDVETYRTFIHGSLAEFTVAKEQNVALRTGWFSDRSATYPREWSACSDGGHRIRRRLR